MSRVCKIILVCEGWRDSAFARAFLKEAGVAPGAVDPKPNPGGCGHDWVAKQFVEEVYNLERFSEGWGVLGLLDEDGQGASVRMGKVARLLQASGLSAINANEGRCLLLPTRNIETWLYRLKAQRCGNPIDLDETADYKSQPPAGVSALVNEDCRPAGEYLHSLNHAALPKGCPLILGQAVGQLRAFLNAVRR
jgi:hypothetical protein